MIPANGSDNGFPWLSDRKRARQDLPGRQNAPDAPDAPRKNKQQNQSLDSGRCWHAARIPLSESIHRPSWGAMSMNKVTKTIAAWALAALAMAICLGAAQAASRIKDLVDVEGVRDNQLIGYGLVVGLNGTGDTLNNIPFTKQSLTAMLERLGVNIRGAQLRTGNVAAVMVTGNLQAFATQGTRLDVVVSALGDAKSLQGGTLLVTPLMGADGNVYAVAQGTVAVAGFQAEGDAAKIVRGVPTVGSISETPVVSQPGPFSRGRTKVVPRTRIGVQEEGTKLGVVQEGVSLSDLVDGLNALGVGPRDLISILQAIKATGAIQAEIEVM